MILDAITTLVILALAAMAGIRGFTPDAVLLFILAVVCFVRTVQTGKKEMEGG